MPIALVVADDHPIILKALEFLLPTTAGFRILATCVDGDQALQAVRRHRPDILLLDLRMPGKDGLVVLRELQQDNLPTRIVLYTAAADEDNVLAAIRLGVQGVVTKEMSLRLLVHCLHEVYEGRLWLDQYSASRTLEKVLRREDEMRALCRVLTPREIDLVRLVAGGLDNRRIAERAHITEGTVKMHLHRIYAKLELKSRLALGLFAREKGLI